MTLLHFLIFMFFLSILTYLALKNGNNTVAVLNAGFKGISQDTVSLQGR